MTPYLTPYLDDPQRSEVQGTGPGSGSFGLRVTLSVLVVSNEQPAGLVLEAPLQLTAFEFRGRLEGGLTEPIVVAAFDEAGLEHRVVLKVRTPAVPHGHFGPTSLACELMCAVLARAVGIPVPDYAIVDVPEEMIPGVSDPRIQSVLRDNLGANFGCRYHHGFALWRWEYTTDIPELLEELEDVFVFDATLLNGDRNRDKPNLLFKGNKTLAIDHSLALFAHRYPTLAELETCLQLPDSVLHRHAVFTAVKRRQRPFQRILDPLALLTPAQAGQLREMVPLAWETEAGHIDKMLHFIGCRSTHFPAISGHLREVAR